MRIIPFVALAILSALLIIGCAKQAPPANAPQPANAATTSPVNIIFLNDSTCPNCQHLESVLDALRASDIKLGTVLLTQYNTTSGLKLIDEYKVAHVPALLLSVSVTQYPGIGQQFLRAGVPAGGYYLLQSPPVYRELSTGNIRGLANLTFLNDSACMECFALEPLKKALGQLGFVAQHERTVDIASAEGQALIKQHNLAIVPTVILTGDLAVYDRLNTAWQEVGSIENNTTYVMRNLNPLGNGIVYKNLTTGILNQSISP